MDELVPNDTPAAGAAASETPAPAAGVQPTAWDATPERFQVRREDGTLDQDATHGKLAESYAALQRRVGVGDIRPKTAAEYALVVPEALQGAFQPDDPGLAAFREHAHGLGLTAAQFQGVMDKYFELAPGLAEGGVSYSGEQAEQSLRQVWTTDAALQENVGLADRALRQLGGDLGDSLLREVQNKPAVIQFLARVGAQLVEDRSPPGIQAAAAPSIQELMSSEAYSNARHPQHAAVSARVQAHFARQPGANNVI